MLGIGIKINYSSILETPMNNPKVSILLMTYNHERFIKRAIESALSQTYENIEI